MELKAQISAITSSAKDSQRAEMESGEGGGPMVTEADIANIVAQWTGIPIEKVGGWAGGGAAAGSVLRWGVWVARAGGGGGLAGRLAGRAPREPRPRV